MQVRILFHSTYFKIRYVNPTFAGHFVCVESGLVIKSQNDSPRVHHHGGADPEESGSHGKTNGHHHGQVHNKNGRVLLQYVLFCKIQSMPLLVDHGGKHPKNRGHHSIAGEEEDLAELRNLELNSASKSTHNIIFALSLLSAVVIIA